MPINNCDKPIGLFSFTGTNNYGGVLQNYALSKQIEKLGYSYEQIFLFGSRNKNSPFYKFRKRYFHLTEPVFTFSHCLQLNDRYDTIVTGSDVVWLQRSLASEMGMLAWASGNKNLVSYAASFGEACYTGDITYDLIAAMLSRFNAVSVREDKGVDICKSLGVAAQHVLDPSLLLDVKEYEMLIENFDGDLSVPDDYIFFYDVCLSSPEAIQLITEKFARYGKTLITGACYDRSTLAPEQWLNLIRNARYVITNSFHGMCFSLIFKKDFIHIHHSCCNSRYDSLYNLFGLNKTAHLLSEIDPLLIENEEKINFNDVEHRLKSLRKSSVKFLADALALSPTYKPRFLDNELCKKKILFFDSKNEPSIDENALISWADEHPFDPTMKSPTRDLLKLSIDLKMDAMFYAYETKDHKVLNERAVARSLLLAHAKRILNSDDFAKVSSDYLYQLDPHKLQVFLNSTLHQLHSKAFKKRIEELGNAKVYILFSVNFSTKIYSYAKDFLVNLNPQAFLHLLPAPSKYAIFNEKTIPVFDLLPFIKVAPPLPIIAFGTCTHYMIPLLKFWGCTNEVIPCAFCSPS
ncbi:polysaccharide pyruvyl transferase family protein [Desulfovibrio sp. ZJ369]|uniref:polysaccharide pyruvyl transferase family protein n=1 Tax=Desulfovibrio sp. ZJ369 TaxID=2709793 RepID=UPI0013ED3F67|nr:polysaccharide pyruvyl transferase family protein [Desulfovibrio sp. ZJ369]